MTRICVNFSTVYNDTLVAKGLMRENFYLLYSQRIDSFSQLKLLCSRYIVTDVLMAMDRGQIKMLGMFDLRTAFDTVDHAILLRWLEAGS